MRIAAVGFASLLFVTIVACSGTSNKKNASIQTSPKAAKEKVPDPVDSAPSINRAFKVDYKYSDTVWKDVVRTAERDAANGKPAEQQALVGKIVEISGTVRAIIKHDAGCVVQLGPTPTAASWVTFAMSHDECEKLQKGKRAVVRGVVMLGETLDPNLPIIAVAGTIVID